MYKIKSVLLLIIAIVTLNPAISMANVTLENPCFGGTNTNTIVITRVELDDTATIIDFNASYYPHYWILIGSDSYLESNGVKYPLIHAEDIVLDEHFWMPDSGEADFKLFFKPLPHDAETFSYIEGEVDDAFRIWGVSLIGNTDNDYPAGLPEALKKEPVDGPLPAPVMSCGTTKANVHILGDKNAYLDAKYDLIYNSILGEQLEMPLKFDNETGVATVEFDQVGTVNAFIVNNSRGFTDLWIAPGETIDIYIDGRINGFIASQSRMKYVGNGISEERNQNTRQPNPHGYLYTTGKYSTLNRLVNKYRFADMPDLWDDARFSYSMTATNTLTRLNANILKQLMSSTALTGRRCSKRNI